MNWRLSCVVAALLLWFGRTQQVYACSHRLVTKVLPQSEDVRLMRGWLDAQPVLWEPLCAS